MFAEYVGLEQDVASQIEALRERASETKNDILRRVFQELPKGRQVSEGLRHLDFSQGIRLPVGEKLYLYLHKPNSRSQQPDGWAEVRADGLYLEGQRVMPSKGSPFAPAMHIIQRRLKHINKKGDLVPLSAYQKWHVIREGNLVELDQLKAPEQRRRRKPKESKVDVTALLAELGISD